MWIKKLLWEYKLRKLAKKDSFIYEYDDDNN